MEIEREKKQCRHLKVLRNNSQKIVSILADPDGGAFFDLHLGLFLTENYCIASKDLRYGVQIIWNTFVFMALLL